MALTKKTVYIAIPTILFGFLVILLGLFTLTYKGEDKMVPVPARNNVVKESVKATTTVVTTINGPEVQPATTSQEVAPVVNLIKPVAVVEQPKSAIINTPIKGNPVKMIPPKPLTPEEQQVLLDEMRKANN